MDHIQHPDVETWRKGLDEAKAALVVDALDRLAQDGPGLGRPLVDTIKGSRHRHMKELRARTIRVLFVFDPKRRAVLLVGGDKGASGVAGTPSPSNRPTTGTTSGWTR